MRNVEYHSQFKRDLKRIKRSGNCSADEISSVVELLQADTPLPERYKDHPLKGAWAPARECHIRSDVLLIYQKPPEILYLLRLGSHSELFNK